MTATQRAYRKVSQLHEHPEVVAWGHTPSGQILIFVLAAVLLRPFELSWLVIPALALVMLMPHRRRLVLSLAAVAAALVTVGARARAVPDLTDPGWWLTTAGVAVLLMALYATYLAVMRFASLPGVVRRRPQICLHGGLWIVVVAAWLVPSGGVHAVLALLAGILPFVVWRAGYLVMSGQRGRAAGTRFQDHLFYLWPVYGGSNAPIGKGHDHLSRHEAGAPDVLVRAQLAGLKLLVLALVWRAALIVMGGLVYGDPDSRLGRLVGGASLGIPRLEALMTGGAAAVRPLAWLSLYVELVRVTLDVAVSGHVVVGSLRLLGFNVFRNTYKPLLATTIVDFWNRFYYYFKELLVDFFFLPSYVRWFRTRPRLRILVATFAAAFVGNLYYQLLRDPDALVAADIASLWQDLSPRLVYSFLLAAGIYVSMVRQQARRGQPATSPGVWAVPRRVAAIAAVWTFYSLIHLWHLRAGDLGTMERTAFFFWLFGL